MIQIKFCGAAGEVTGSRHILETASTALLLDCGLFQGHRIDALNKNRGFLFPVDKISATLLSHAHIDHSGSLPILMRSGFKGPIHCTKGTQELASVMLPDSGRLQQEDTAFFNKIHAAEGHWIAPLYTEDDAIETLRQFIPHPYNTPIPLTPDITAAFLNAGHVLGSAMIQVDIKKGSENRRILYTGDLGRRTSLLLQGPEIPKAVDYLVIESTYGDRLHAPVQDAGDALTQILHQAVAQKGKVLIPSFALERTQEIIFILQRLRRQGLIPPIPVFVDSPMAVRITDIFNSHLNDLHLSPEFKDFIRSGGDPFGFGLVTYIRSVEDSKRLNEIPGPMISLSGSGMCEGGRILHHLRNNIGKSSTIVLLVGYQAEGTLGRRLSDGSKKVKIFGLEHEVMAEIKTLSFFSAHADRGDLLWFIESLRPAPRKIFLVHGDPADRSAMTELLENRGITQVVAPTYGASVELD